MAGILNDRHRRLRSTKQVNFSEAELAVHWGISRRTLQRWRKDGRGPRWLRIEGRVLYRIADIEQYERAHLEGGDT